MPYQLCITVPVSDQEIQEVLEDERPNFPNLSDDEVLRQSFQAVLDEEYDGGATFTLTKVA